MTSDADSKAQRIRTVSIQQSIKRQFHRDLAADPVVHAWVLNLYRAGERYPQNVCDYFQSDFAPCEELAAALRRHSADEERHVRLLTHAIESLDQPVTEMDCGDVFNQVIRSVTPGSFHIVESDAPEVRRRKLANFLAHAHWLEKRVAQSFAYHLDACEGSGRRTVLQVVEAAKRDEDRHVQYTREAVFDLLPRREAQNILDLHRRVEARANLMFSQRQVRTFLRVHARQTPVSRRALYRVCAWLMEHAGEYA